MSFQLRAEICIFSLSVHGLALCAIEFHHISLSQINKVLLYSVHAFLSIANGTLFYVINEFPILFVYTMAINGRVKYDQLQESLLENLH